MAKVKPEMEALRHELLDGIVEAAKMLACDFGMESEKAEQLGNAIADWVADTHGGTTLVIPMDYHFHRSKRDFEMYNKFTGHNYSQLARDYGIHDRSVRRIIGRIQKLIVKKSQADMFD